MAFDFKSPDYTSVLVTRAKRLAAIRSDPALLAACKIHYRDHPADFIDDWAFSQDPRNIERGLPSVIPLILFPRQREWVDWTVDNWKHQRHGITEKSRDCGCSVCLTALSCTLCLFHRGMAINLGSRKEDYVDRGGDPKSLFYKARMFMQYLPPEFTGGWDVGNPKHSSHMRLTFPHMGSTITGEAGDNIGRGDRAALVFIDEAAHLEHPDLVDASLSATTNCRQDVSSVNGMANSFATRRHSGKIPVFHFSWRSDPRKDEAWYEKQKATLPATTVAQEIDCNYSASTDCQLIPGEWVQLAVDAHVKLKLRVTGSKRGALDVADVGSDKNCFVTRQGILLTSCTTWSGAGSDIFATTERAFAIADGHGCRDWDFDGDGLGAGVRGDARKINEARKLELDRTHVTMKARMPPVHTVGSFRGSESPLWPDAKVKGPDGTPLDRTNADAFQNRKSQGWWSLRFRFEQTMRALQGLSYDTDEIISIDSKLPELTQLLSELSQPTYKLNGAGKIMVDKKPDGVASPNRADSVMYCYAPRRQAMKIAASLLA